MEGWLVAKRLADKRGDADTPNFTQTAVCAMAKHISETVIAPYGSRKAKYSLVPLFPPNAPDAQTVNAKLLV